METEGGPSNNMEHTTMVFKRIFGARGLAAALLIGAGAGMMAGCETTQVAVQWSNPEFAGRALRGEKVLVVCEAPDIALRQVCQQQVAAQLQASGAMPVISPDDGLTVGPPPANDKTLAAARAAGARPSWDRRSGPM